MAGAQRAQRALPVLLAAEVGDDDDEAAVAGERRGALRARRPATSRPRGRPPAPRAARPAAPSRPRRPWRGRSTRGSPPPSATTPSRLPRRVATWPIASATPSATSALRRSAVPNVIEAETSSSSHAVIARSPTCTRTCGSLHPRGHVPVDVAHVVAGPVGPDQRELGAAADLRREVLAGHQALDPPQHRQIEVAQDRRRDRAGPRPLGRALRRGQARRGPAVRRAPAAHGSLPIRSSASTQAASSSASAAPAKDEVTSCLTFLVENRVPRFA